MRILYLTDSKPDYMSDDLLYGLRSVLGDQVVDYPQKKVLYKTFEPLADRSEIYGQGFHCFGLPQIEIDRSDIFSKVRTGYFDLIVNSSANRIKCPLHPNLVVVDGEDYHYLSTRYYQKVAAYFKREVLGDPPDVEPILFALPDFLLDESRRAATKTFHSAFRAHNAHREELAAVAGANFSFTSWPDYIEDIKSSTFAISPKGAGYDCQRHYEILGNSILCLYMDENSPAAMKEAFRDGENCLHFRNAAELKAKVESCKDRQALLEAGIRDLKDCHLASKRAEQFLAVVKGKGLKRTKLSFADALAWMTWLLYFNYKAIRGWSPEKRL